MSKHLNAEITEELLREAKNNPNGWVYKIDQGYDLSGHIIPEAIAGAWKIDEKGNIIGKFIHNKNYVPSNTFNLTNN